MSYRLDYLNQQSTAFRQIDKLRCNETLRQSLAIAFLILVSLAPHTFQLLCIAGICLIVAGSSVRLWASGCILKNQELATEGPYTLVRHPLYLGNILLLAGFSIASGQWWSVLLLIVYLWFFYPLAVAYEDYKLHRKFAGSWKSWCDATPALVPRLAAPNRRLKAPWSIKKSLYKNGEPLLLLFVLVMLLVMEF